MAVFLRLRLENQTIQGFKRNNKKPQTLDTTAKIEAIRSERKHNVNEYVPLAQQKLK